MNRLISFMGEVKDDNLKTILANMQTMREYQAEKIRIYEEHLAGLTGKDRPELTDSDKRRLAQKSKALNDYLLASIEPTWAPGTIRHWYNTLVGAKYNSTGRGQKKRGRKPVSPEIVAEVLRLVKRNSDWGYDRIAGTMRYLGYDVCASTVKKHSGRPWDYSRFGTPYARGAALCRIKNISSMTGIHFSTRDLIPCLNLLASSSKNYRYFARW